MSAARYAKSLAGILLLTAVAATAFVVTRPATTEDDPPAVPHFELASSETEWLWELEHRANVLGEYGFSTLKKALSDSSADALTALLHSDFHGLAFDRAVVTSFNSPTLTAVRSEADSELTELTGPEFIDRLLLLRAEMDDMQQCSIGVKRIGPVDRAAPEGRWTTLCEMWMRGMKQGDRIEVTTLFQLDTQQPDRQTLSQDGWILNWTLMETSVSSGEHEMFEDVTEAAGVDATALHDNWLSPQKINNPGGVYACDFNRDGQTDFLVTDVNPVGNSLYQNIGEGRFRDVTNTIGIGSLRQISLSQGNAAFIDVNNDGWVDLLHTQGGLWENDRGLRFIDRTRDTNLFQIANPAQDEIKSVSVADYDRDGLLDLYVLRRNEMPMSWLESTGRGPGSLLCRNLGHWQFEDATEVSGTHGHEALIFTTVWLDANNDNWPDLAVINEFGDSFLYVNQQNGRFEHRDPDPDKSDFGSMGIDVGDVNNDGHIDLYIAGMYSKAGSRIIGNLPQDAFPPDVRQRLDSLIDGSELYMNRGGLDFEASGQQQHVHNIGWSWGPTLADFNNDGWLDIYAPSGYMSRDRNKPDG
ncbi:MAG: VCBS repeat-containing protein [Fuerstiella sp.]